MNLTITTVDAFTNKMFGGNPAAVTIVPEALGEAAMQDLAMEMNLAETAFLQKREDGSFDLRWFTPATEVDLCGHATVASAHVLWQTGALPESEIARFHTRSGLLTAAKRGDWVELDFPATPVTQTPAPPDLLESFEFQPTYIGRSKFDYFLEVAEQELRSAKPNLSQLAKVASRGVIVTSRSTSSEFDFISRFFAPASGIDEDPVTGSAHCALAPYWSEKLGKNTMMAHQASKRGGEVRVELKGDRVLLSGQAVTVVSGSVVLAHGGDRDATLHTMPQANAAS